MSAAKAISPYLLDTGGLNDPHLTVREEARPINGLPRLVIGSKPIDGGHYIFNAEERAALLEEEPDAAPFLRPYVGAREYLQGGERWILALQEAEPTQLRDLPRIRERMAQVREYRLRSKSKGTVAIADYATKYHVEVLPKAAYLVVPEVSSNRRDYVPIGWLEPPAIPSNLLRVLRNATLAEFALLTSSMHMAWMRTVAGRLGSGYRYSVGVVYNTFPTPLGYASGEANLGALEPLAQGVLDARKANPGQTLADLYDPLLMPTNLRHAHRALDRAVDRLYRPSGFDAEARRVGAPARSVRSYAYPARSKQKTKAETDPPPVSRGQALNTLYAPDTADPHLNAVLAVPHPSPADGGLRVGTVPLFSLTSQPAIVLGCAA